MVGNSMRATLPTIENEPGHSQWFCSEIYLVFMK